MRCNLVFPLTCSLLLYAGSLHSQLLQTNGVPAQLDIRPAGESSVRIVLKPVAYKDDFLSTPAVVDKPYPAAVISIRELKGSIKKKVGNLMVEVRNSPLRIRISNQKGDKVQYLAFLNDGRVSFDIEGQPVLGMGEGGPKAPPGVNWRNLPIQYDRRGQYDSMQPRWQSGAYGSRNPVPVLMGTQGWGLFVANPWVEVDLREKDKGYLIPWKPPLEMVQQDEHNQQLNLGKGLPPAGNRVPGLLDLFVFDGHQPAKLMKDFSEITGPASMPPIWALGYMQSFRTLEDENQMIGIVDTFREKKIPIDAVIYLGTGFAPRGWNTRQPSFQFNPQVFKRDPHRFFEDMHDRDVKVILHMVPWGRDQLPGLHGTIPPSPGEVLDASHISNYWKPHVALLDAGVDGFWPDEGDWFNLFERIKRHQMYYQGSLSARPNQRPWSLQRNGYPGIAQWGGWVWSGDTESSWKTLEGQITVGINYSLSIGPYWGSDIGGFYSNTELTGELYARWFQFASFCGSFRSHGRTWHTRLPWGWGLDHMGFVEDRVPPLSSELNNPAIEPITRKYDELRYRLMPYTYTLSWEARQEGMPLQRAMWLHYPEDTVARGLGTQFMWGRDLLIAPVYEKGAISRKVYLPKGDWYDWWSHKKIRGGQVVSRAVDLSVMPIYVRAGAIIPIAPLHQHTGETMIGPLTLQVFPGSDGSYTLFQDDGISNEYLQGKGSWTRMIWKDASGELTIEPGAPRGFTNQVFQQDFRVELVGKGIFKDITYESKKVSIKF